MTEHSSTIRNAPCASDPELVSSLERGLRMLTEFSPREPLFSGSELARRLDIPRTTVFRLLQTLESFGVLERFENAYKYRLGAAVLRLGFESLNSLELTDLAIPVLDRLRNTTGMTSHIVIREGRDVVFVAKAQSRTPILSLVKIDVGTRFPAHATIHGHVLMGDLTLCELSGLFPERDLKQYTPHTPKTVEALHELVRQAALCGYAVSESLFEVGISVVTAPVRDERGRVAAAVAVTIPRAEIGSTELASGLVEQVRTAADELSLRRSYRPRFHSLARA